MKLLLIKVCKFLMVPLGAVCMLFKKRNNILILMYHRVNDSISKEISVTKSNFIWQMKYLKRKGYKVITLDDAINLQIDKSEKIEKYVVLTFDDGYEDFFTDAYPVMSQLGYPSIVYLVTSYIESNKVFWWDRDIGESKLMNWAQINILNQSDLVEFGSHTISHPDFNSISIDNAEDELKDSQVILQNMLFKNVNHFAYPRGIVTPDTAILAEKYYNTAVSIFDGNDINCGKFNQLKRIPVQRSDGRSLFNARLKGWLAPEEWLKKLLGRH